MQIRYCCKPMYETLFEDDAVSKVIHKLIVDEDMKYCPFCGAVIQEIKLYGNM